MCASSRGRSSKPRSHRRSASSCGRGSTCSRSGTARCPRKRSGYARSRRWLHRRRRVPLRAALPLPGGHQPGRGHRPRRRHARPRDPRLQHLVALDHRDGRGDAIGQPADAAQSAARERVSVRPSETGVSAPLRARSLTPSASIDQGVQAVAEDPARGQAGSVAEDDDVLAMEPRLELADAVLVAGELRPPARRSRSDDRAVGIEMLAQADHAAFG